jgi:hypothetical protein
MEHATVVESKGLYGLMAEFEHPGELVKAAKAAHDAGYHSIEAYSPYPIEEVFDAIHFHSDKVPFAVLCGGLAGCASGLGLQWWASVLYYPFNIGGRPNFSWPMFIPITFELTILLASFAAVFGMLMMNGLPQPYHPVFNVPRFALASRDRFFLCIGSQDPHFDREKTGKFLESLAPREVTEVAY